MVRKAMRNASEMTDVELLNAMSHWEDHGDILQLMPSDTSGGVLLYHMEWDIHGEGKTFKDAIIAYKQKYLERYDEGTEYNNVDWYK